MRRLLMSTACAAVLAMPAFAGNWSIAIPEALPDGGAEVKAEAWRFFLQSTGPGDAFAVLNATEPGVLASIAIPDETKYERAKWRVKTFARDSGAIAAHFDQLADGTPDTDIIGILRHIALTRLDPDLPLDLMIAGTALQAFKEMPELAMAQDGVVFVPSPDHLEASIKDTGYGMGAEQSDGLQNVYLHLCPLADELRSDEEAALQGFYANYVAARGGTLVSWSTDVPTCFARFAAEVRDPLEIAQYADPTGELTMVRVGEAKPTVIVETEPTTVIVNGIEVEQFNIFSSMAHPTLRGKQVTTGVVYVPGKYPDEYERSYCYFNVRKNGASIQVDVGSKRFGKPVVWASSSESALRTAGVTEQDVVNGRSACQFPTP